MSRLHSTFLFFFFLLLFCLFGTGCCTMCISDICHVSTGNDIYLKKRILEYNEEENAYYLKYETKKKRYYFPKQLCNFSVKSHKEKVVKFSLDNPPPKAKLCKLYVRTNDYAKKAERSQFNFVSSKMHDEYFVRARTLYPMTFFTCAKRTNLDKNPNVYLTLNQENLPSLSKPFVLVDFRREDYPLYKSPRPWRKKNERNNLMIPYKQIGDCYYAYVAPNVESWMLAATPTRKYESNTVTYVSNAILGVPAFLVDIVLSPIYWPYFWHKKSSDPR